MTTKQNILLGKQRTADSVKEPAKSQQLIEKTANEIELVNENKELRGTLQKATTFIRELMSTRDELTSQIGTLKDAAAETEGQMKDRDLQIKSLTAESKKLKSQILELNRALEDSDAQQERVLAGEAVTEAYRVKNEVISKAKDEASNIVTTATSEAEAHRNKIVTEATAERDKQLELAGNAKSEYKDILHQMSALSERIVNVVNTADSEEIAEDEAKSSVKDTKKTESKASVADKKVEKPVAEKVIPNGHKDANGSAKKPAEVVKPASKTLPVSRGARKQTGSKQAAKKQTTSVAKKPSEITNFEKVMKEYQESK